MTSPESPPAAVIGLTGTIGAGKSAVCRYLAARTKMVYIDADGICRELLEPHALGWIALQDLFGDSYFAGNSQLNRPQLRADLFADAGLRRQINALLHPLARQAIRKLTTVRHVVAGRGFLVEVPLLFEAGWQDDFNHVMTVYADPDTCLSRLMKRDGITRLQAAECLGVQIAGSIKALHADYVVDNSGPWPFTCLQLNHLAMIL